MAAIKLTYIGGGSTRGVGTMASFADQGSNFDGSEVVLFDIDHTHLDLVRRLAQKMLDVKGLDITVRATTDRRAALDGADAVLASYRPGGFAARALDERIPLRHGVIGQETQGPGGFFMALRAITAMKEIVADMADLCPNATLFNYTNPINIVGQAVSDHTDINTVSLCEGPIVYPQWIANTAGLDPDAIQSTSIGLNHGSWSVAHTYHGEPLMPVLEATWAERRATVPRPRQRIVDLAVSMGSLPSNYFQYYFCEREILAELQAKPTTRAEDILAEVPSYWQHYEEQLETDEPVLDPRRSRGGIHELELAVDCMDAVFNDKGETMPVNVPNQGSIPGFPDSLVVETLGKCDSSGIHPEPMPALSVHLRGVVESLACYQQAAADTAWEGTALDGIRTLASHPLVRSLDVADAIYREMAHAHREYLPQRLLA